MKIGVLEAGLLREKLAGRFDPYPVMFERLIGQSGRAFDYDAVSVVRGEKPSSIDQCDGWLITGSRHGVYDNLDWMPPLKEFIRELAVAGKPLIGVCFGHQIIADALGGEVVKSDKGWGVGLHRYRIDAPRDWMAQVPEDVGIYAFHQDQIVTLPPGRNRAPYVLGGLGAYVSFDADDTTGGPTLHGGIGWVQSLSETTLFYEVNPALLVGETAVDLVLPFRIGVIF